MLDDMVHGAILSDYLNFNLYEDFFMKVFFLSRVYVNFEFSNTPVTLNLGLRNME